MKLVLVILAAFSLTAAEVPRKNRLAGSTSRYLLQHATNPVDWYPWGDEAFAKAKAEDKPIFLSIGYSTCHWCHVMERESFSDPEIARLMNETFVAIKVDREERPDLDSVYLEVARTLTGEGGWPNNVGLTPDGKPFLAISYLPKDRFHTFVVNVGSRWHNQRGQVSASAEMILRSLRPESAASIDGVRSPPNLGTPRKGSGLQDRERGQVSSERQSEEGQISDLGKERPDPIGAGKQRPDPGGADWGQVSRPAESTLPPRAENTHTSEIFDRGYRQLLERSDPVNGGFLPEPKFPRAHQLMFLLRYWRRSGEPRALAMVETTLRAMRRSPLWDASGFGFHRYAGKADWSEPHYEKMLYDQALLALAYLEAHQATGKAEYAQTARDIFTYVLRDLRAPGGAFFAAQDADERYYTAADRSKLAAPARDEKILPDWNGLMIAALSYGSVVLDEPKYADAAKRAADVVVARPRRFLDDHAFLVWGLLNLYEATFDIRYLRSAIAIEDLTLARFRDGEGRFYLTASDAEQLLVRPREVADGAIPSGNSVQLMNLLRLARITADRRYETSANELLGRVSDEMDLAPSTVTHLLSGLAFALGPSFEIVLAGEDVREMQRAVFAPFVPNKVVVHRPAGDAPPIISIAPFTTEQRPIGGQATAYVCTNYACRLPTTDVKKLKQLLSPERETPTTPQR